MDEIYDIENEKEELFEHFNYIVDQGQKVVRIDKFLCDRLSNHSRNRIQNAAKAESILVNNKAVKSNYRVKPGDVISIVLDYPVYEHEILAQDIPIDIVYEDEHLIIINKAPGMVVHPAYGNWEGTLVNALMYHFNKLPGKDPLRPGLVHRIDKNTSGIMVIAKTEESMAKMAKNFFDRTIDRKYIALVWGNVEQDEGTITGNIGRSLKDRKIMDVFPEGDYGKHAVTHYKVIERFNYTTLIECKLETGRTHQIRVHFKYIKHNLFNDQTYGGEKILKGTTFTKYKQFIQNCFNIMPRHALHAKSLGFNHPVTGEYMYFDSELPYDMQTVIDKWRVYNNSKDLLDE